MGLEKMTPHDERYLRAEEFMAVCFKLRNSFEEVVDLVVPVLQQRGVFRKAYAGTKLRDHFQQTE
jgi:hypothetical protein